MNNLLTHTARSQLIRRLALGCLFLVLLAFFSSTAASAERPNLVVALIDDMGWADLSCFGGQGPKTQNIDRLASEGLSFTNFYVNSPICSPSRAALLTGQYPARWRITSFLSNRADNQRRGMAQWLDPQAPSLARFLDQAGYTCGHFGKWHLGGQRDVGEAPAISEYGFDASLTNFEGLGPRVLPLCDAHDGQPPKRHALGSDKLGRGPIQWLDRSQVTAAFVGRAIEFIDQAHQEGRPFYINLWPDDVHSPFFPPAGRRGDGQKRTLYHAVLDTMDEQLGVLFDHIRNSDELRDNTLVILASDNGPEPGAGSADPLRGVKGTLYEGGIRSPLIVWGPGLISADKRGTRNETSVLSSIDLAPSLLKIADVPPPADIAFDGLEMSETLLGKSNSSRTQPLYWRRPPDRPGRPKERLPDLAVRDGAWKLLVEYDGSNPRLFDIVNDPAETNDLAAEEPQVTQRLQQAVLAWNARLPQDAGQTQTASLPAGQFVNPVMEGADPWVARHEDQYVWCQSEGNRAIAVHVSPRLTRPGPKHIVWRAPEKGPVSREVWAPEMHLLDGRWHIYFAASDGKNANHLSYVLRSAAADPLGPYELHGPLYTGDDPALKSDNRWAIDFTVLEHGGRRYGLWSGWLGKADDMQHLFIAPLADGVTIAGPRVKLCAHDDYLWERTEEKPGSRGLHEAPQVLKHGKRTFVTYSTAASWLPTYKLGLLELVGDDPLSPSAWKKHPQPVFEASDETYGVGHASFVPSPDGEEWWIVYHAKRDRRPGWRRAVLTQPFHWSEEGFPEFGRPVAEGVPLELPSGEQTVKDSEPKSITFDEAELPGNVNYYGHHQFIRPTAKGLHLGDVPSEPVNAYRSGEKLLLEAGPWTDADFETRLEIVDGERDAGLLFRVTGAAVGYDAHRGYFAGILSGGDRVVLGLSGGAVWRELAQAAATIEPNHPYELKVQARGPQITVFLDGRQVLACEDDTFGAGGAGLRVVDTHARFDYLKVKSHHE